MHKPHWLFIDTAYDFGGHEVMLLRWLREVHQQAYIKPVLIARADTRLYGSAPKGVLAIPLSGIGAQRNQRSLLPSVMARIASRIIDACRLARYVLRLQPELAVVAEGSVLSQAWVTLVLRILSIKTVIYVPLTQSGIEMGFGRGAARDWLVRKFYRHIPFAWITLTAEQAQHLASWSRIKRPILVLPNTVAPEMEAAIEMSKTQAATSTSKSKSIRQPLRVLILGRLDAHQKGLDTLLNFLCFRIELSNDFHFTFVGDGPYRPQIEQRLSVFPSLQKIITLQPWSDTTQVMQQHDVLLLASRYEGVPLVMLEAMALGLPVIATDLPGTRALLSSECLFSVGDYEHAMRLLYSIYRDEVRTAMVRRNRETFRRKVSGAAFATAVGSLTTKLFYLIHPELNEPMEAALDISLVNETRTDDVTVIET